MADDKKIIVDPSGPTPSTIVVDKAPETKSEAATPNQVENKSNSSPTTATALAQPSSALSLSDSEAKSWIDKPVFSSDGKNIGKVVEFQRDSDKKIAGMHADIGGFFGYGQTRVSLTAAHLKLQNDRVLLDLTAAQAKELPKVKI
jgi:hypothetical protein